MKEEVTEKKKRKKRRKRAFLKEKPRKLLHQYSTNKQRENLIFKGRLATVNANKYDDLRQPLLDWGMKQETLDQGAELTKKADDAWNFYTNQRNRYKASKGDFDEKVQVERSRFIGHVRLARVGVGNHVEYNVSLDLKGKRKEDLTGWSVQARKLYKNALDKPELKPILKTVGLNHKTLKEGLDMVAELERDENKLAVLRGEVSQALFERDNAFEELALWLKAFTQVCIIVFDRGEPERQKLERLGIPAKNIEEKTEEAG